MKYTLLFFFIMAYTFDTKAFHEWQNSKGRIFISEISCELLRDDIESISLWKQRHNETPLYKTIDCQKNPNLKKMDITDIFPSEARKIYGIYSACDGPNCFNAAAISSQLAEYQVYFDKRNWKKSLKANCELRPSKEFKAGDLVSIRRRVRADSFKDEHGFIVINDHLAYSKNGFSGLQTVHLQPLLDVLTQYGVNKNTECINPQIIPPKKTANCNMFYNFYNCDSHKKESPSPSLKKFESLLADCAKTADPKKYSELKDFLRKDDAIKNHLSSSQADQLEALEYIDRQPLIFPIVQGDLQGLKNLVSAGADINKAGPIGSPLFEASRRGNIPILNYLLEHKANIDEVGGPLRETPLSIAVISNHRVTVENLIEKGADINKPDINERGPLIQAVLNKRHGLVRYLVKKGADINKADRDEMSPLHYASLNSYLTDVKFLVENGANIEQKNGDGFSPLALASLEGHVEIVEYLISQGASLDTVGKRGHGPLHLAAEKGHGAILELILKYKKNTDKDYINKATLEGFTALHSAVSSEDLNLVEFLLKQGADINKTSGNGESPLFLAAKNGQLNIVKYLVERGGNIEAANNTGFTPLNAAADYGHLEVLQYLVEKGAQIEAANSEGFTPLAQAVFSGYSDVVKFLIKQKANPHAKGKDGRSILELAKKPFNKDHKDEILDDLNRYIQTYK